MLLRNFLASVLACVTLIDASSLHAGHVSWSSELRSVLLSNRDVAVPSRGPIVLQFWASWCGGCVALSMTLDQSTKAWPGVSLLGISIDQHLADAQKGTMRFGALIPTIALVFDNHSDWAKRFNVTSVPTVVIVDSEGQERFRSVGHLNAADMLAIERTLAQLVSLNVDGSRP